MQPLPVLETIVHELDPRHDLDILMQSQSILNYLITAVKPLIRGGAIGYLAALLTAKAIGAEEAYTALSNPSLDAPAEYFLPVYLGASLDYMQTAFRCFGITGGNGKKHSEN